MILNLKDILTIYICPDHDKKYHDRKIHMDTLLNKLQFTNVVHFKSSTDNYPHCLNKAYIDIFNKYQPPFLLLEDDIEINEDVDLKNLINIPDDTDAFYLGLSNVAGDKFNNHDTGVSTFKYIDNNVLKVKNMLGAHAVLYMSTRYSDKVKNTISNMPKTYYNDVAISRIQSEYNVYTYRNHYFYQAKELGGHEIATRISIPMSRIENYPCIPTVTFVTCFININNLDYNTIETNYISYFKKLVNTGISIVLYIDNKYEQFEEYIQNCTNVKIRYIDKDSMWINTINKKLPIERNIKKDTEDYLKLMNYKIYFMEMAVNENIFNHGHYAWIDFRIYHIFKNEENIKVKLNDISSKIYPNNITYFPGNWKNKIYLVNKINWRFLGGFCLMDANNVKKLALEMTKLLNSSIEILSWETNYWALLEFYKLFNFGWYKADHNDTILDIL